MLPTPRYLGTRWRSPRGDLLVLWQWTFLSGRRRVNPRDCPECADGRVEVGHDSSVAECLDLARFLLRSERGPRAADELGPRFCDDVVAHLPRSVPWWSIDACTIRAWVDNGTPVVASWEKAEHLLPPPRSGRPRFTPGMPDPRPPALFVPDATTATMDTVLAGIEGEAF